MAVISTESNIQYVIGKCGDFADYCDDVIKGLVAERGFSESRARSALDQLFALMRLNAAEPGIAHSPSVCVDEAWHIARKHPRHDAFCKALIGAVMIHNEVGRAAIGDPVAAVTFTVSRLHHHQLPVIESCWQVNPDDEIGCTDSAGSSGGNGSRPPKR